MAGARRAGRRRTGEAPQLRRHEASGRAFVFYGGRSHYLGPWNTAEARRAYREFVGRWESANRPRTAPATSRRPGGLGVTVAELVDEFDTWADGHYRRQDGSPTDEVRAFRVSLAPLVARHAGRSVEDILARDLREIVDGWKASKLARKTINKRLGRLKFLFRWGAGEPELVTETTAARLSMVRGLALGDGVETDEVQPVPLRDLAATLRALPGNLATMARVQYYSGARPGEVCRMRADEVHKTSIRLGGRTIKSPPGVWIFTPGQHKTVKRGQFVFYFLGPRCQAALLPFIEAARDGFLFYARRQQVNPCYRPDHYSKEVGDRAEAAGVSRWSPGRLRHNFLTRWDAIAGIEAGSSAVSHRHLSTTAVYVQRDMKRIGPIALELG